MALRKSPHPEEAAEQPSRRTHRRSSRRISVSSQPLSRWRRPAGRQHFLHTLIGRDREKGQAAIEALRLMEDRRYRHLPIVDGSKVVRIVSRFYFSGIELDRLDEETGLWERI